MGVTSNETRVLVNTPAAPSPPTGLLGMVAGSSVALAWRNTFAGGQPSSLVLDVTGSAVASIPIGLAETLSMADIPAGTYTMAVRAINAQGASAPSNAVTLTFPQACSGPPEAPANFLLYRLGNVLHAVWEAASHGTTPMSYRLDVSGSLTGVFELSTRSASAAVQAGTYSVTVRARNTCGLSPPTLVQTVSVS
jgi:hypothetical protein